MKIKSFISVLLVFILMNGCTLVGVGAASAAGGTYYISGEIKASYPVSIYHLYEICLYTFQEEGIRVSSVKNTKKDADIEAELSDATPIKVHIYYNKEGAATIGLRIGVIGDEKRSRELLGKMQRYI